MADDRLNPAARGSVPADTNASGARLESAASMNGTTNASGDGAVRAATVRHAGTSPAVPAEAPPGTDPALWSVLTAAERAFFARQASTGPLTYTRMMGQLNAPHASTLPRGGRVDVRV